MNVILTCQISCWTVTFKDVIETAQPHWRDVVSTATQLGVPIPAFSSALAYFDSYRNSRLSANLIQAMRDYFGAHTYHKIDGDGNVIIGKDGETNRFSHRMDDRKPSRDYC